MSDLVTRNAADVVTFPEMDHSTGSIGFIERMIIGELLMIAQPKLLVETGTFHGCTTKFVCEFVKTNRLPPCRIATFDQRKVVQEIRLRDPYFTSADNIELVGGLLPGSLKKYLEASAQMVDFAIIDADHSYNGVLGDLETLKPHMKPGGYVFAHDYRNHDPEYAGLVAAVDQFAAANGFAMLPLNPTELGEWRGVWGSAILRKPDEDAIRPSSTHLYHQTIGKLIFHLKQAMMSWLRR